MRKFIFLLSLFIVFNSCSRQNKDEKYCLNDEPFL